MFLESGRVDRVTLYLAPKIMGEGRSLFHFTAGTLSSLPALRDATIEMCGSDFKVSGRLS